MTTPQEKQAGAREILLKCVEDQFSGELTMKVNPDGSILFSDSFAEHMTYLYPSQVKQVLEVLSTPSTVAVLEELEANIRREFQVEVEDSDWETGWNSALRSVILILRNQKEALANSKPAGASGEEGA